MLNSGREAVHLGPTPPFGPVTLRSHAAEDHPRTAGYGLLSSFFELQAEAAGNVTTFTERQAYLQLGGLTAGYAWSPYAFYDPNYQAEYFAPYFGEQGRRTLISYTAPFDKSFATLSIEDNRTHRASTNFGGTVNNTTGGSSVPDIVGVLGYNDNKDGWGRVQVMELSIRTVLPLQSMAAIGAIRLVSAETSTFRFWREPMSRVKQATPMAR